MATGIDFETNFLVSTNTDNIDQLNARLVANIVDTNQPWDVLAECNMSQTAVQAAFKYCNGNPDSNRIPEYVDVSFAVDSSKFLPQTGDWMDVSINQGSNGTWNAADTDNSTAGGVEGGPSRMSSGNIGQQGIPPSKLNNPPAPCKYEKNDANEQPLWVDLGNRYVYSLVGNRPFFRNILSTTSDTSLNTYLRGEINVDVSNAIVEQLKFDCSGDNATSEGDHTMYHTIQGQLYSKLVNDASGRERLIDDHQAGNANSMSGMPINTGDTISIYLVFGLVQYDLLNITGTGNYEGPIKANLQSNRGAGSDVTSKQNIDESGVPSTTGMDNLSTSPYDGINCVVYKLKITIT